MYGIMLEVKGENKWDFIGKMIPLNSPSSDIISSGSSFTKAIDSSFKYEKGDGLITITKKNEFAWI